MTIRRQEVSAPQGKQCTRDKEENDANAESLKRSKLFTSVDKRERGELVMRLDMNVELSRLGNYISPPSIESSDPYFSTPANIEKGWSWEGKTEVEEEETA